MENKMEKMANLLNEGKKVARLKGNRNLDPQIVKKKKESMKKFGLLVPAVIMKGEDIVKQDIKIEDFETETEISAENANQYIVLIEGNHRYKAHLELLKANENLEEGQKYKNEFYVIYPLNPKMQAAKMLAEINVCTKPWKTRDIVAGAEMINKDNCPRLLLEINKLMGNGYSLNSASLWLTFNSKVTKEVMDTAMQGIILDPLKNDSGIERGEMILEVAKDVLGEKLCKSRVLSTWVTSKYDHTPDPEKAGFANKMMQFMKKITKEDVEYIQNAKGKRGIDTKESLINKKLNVLWKELSSSVTENTVRLGDDSNIEDAVYEEIN